MNRSCISIRRACGIGRAMALAVLASSALMADVEFTFLDATHGPGEWSYAEGISADGTFIVGQGTNGAFVWNEADGMVGLSAGTARDISADGNFVTGQGLNGAVRWSRFPTLTETKLTPAGDSPGAAFAISSSGDQVVGVTAVNFVEQGFRWTPTGGRILIPGSQTAYIISPDGKTIAGRTPGGNLYRLLNGTTFQDLGRIENPSRMIPLGLTADGKTICGYFDGATGEGGVFLWKEGSVPPFKLLRRNFIGGDPLVIDRVEHFAGISANGRVIADSTGRIYLDEKGPFDLHDILKTFGVDIPPFVLPFTCCGGVTSSLLMALSDDGLHIAGQSTVRDPSEFLKQAWRVRFHDTDQNGLPDEVEQYACGLLDGAFLGPIEAGTNRFANALEREVLGYGDMISQYGRPWKRGKNRVPEQDITQPAEHLRALLANALCPDGTAIATAAMVDRYLRSVAFPAVKEIHSFEMLLGNEAYADALDPTIGLDGMQPDDLSEEFAFKGVVSDLLDEELALLRGLELPGLPAGWLNESEYYKEYINPVKPAEKQSAAVYNRLPPNAGPSAGPAYRSNYKAADNFIAAGKFPQGHGDAYGHYLTAIKTSIALLTEMPGGLPENQFHQIAILATTTDAGLETVRRIADAGAARARSAALVAELLYRRDYRENPNHPRTPELFSDPDPERAWSMGDWARRGAMGAYLDYATAAHWAPTDELRTVHRGNLVELDDLAGSVSGFQERLDTAGAGLDPLGLVQNVVPFGIDASGLGRDAEGNYGGRSHFEQVFDAASETLSNARKAFESANQASLRLRDSDKAFADFTEKLEDTKADKNQELVEIFGLPSRDDDEDNDLDPDTDDLVESESRPDLVRFFEDDAALAQRGMRPRAAPGQVLLAMSELRVATLRLEQAELVIEDIAEQIKDQLRLIETLEDVQRERIEIISQAGEDQIQLTRRLEQLAANKKLAGQLGGMITGFLFAGDNPQGTFGIMSQLYNDSIEQMLDGIGLNEFDVEVERTRIQTWKEIELSELDHRVRILTETNQLKALLRKSPSLLLDLLAAREVATQSLGRLQQSITRGRLVFADRERLTARTQGLLLEERWKDMSFRVFRNATLKNYRVFFDLAARYVVLAGRAFAYEFDKPSTGDDVLAGIYRERRLGSSTALGTGLQGVLNELEIIGRVSKFNAPFQSLGIGDFSLRTNLLGIGVEDFPKDDLRFRAFLESRIVERTEDLPEIRELARISVSTDYGPAIVIPFETEIDGRNFFGRGPDLPFGNSNYSPAHNAKIRSYAIRLVGVSAALGTNPQTGAVFVYLLPTGDSVLRENTNKPVIEDELITPWAVVDQFLPLPRLQPSNVSDRAYNPWASMAEVGGNFLNEIKRQEHSLAQIELGQDLHFNTNLAGRSAWNTRWLLVIPGGQWTGSLEPSVIRSRLLEFIYGPTGDPGAQTGITDIRLILHAYSH